MSGQAKKSSVGGAILFSHVKTKPFRFRIKVSKLLQNHIFNFFFQSAFKIFQMHPDGPELVQNCSLDLRTSFPTPKHVQKSFLGIFEKSIFGPQNRFFRLHPHKSMKKRVFQRRGVPNIFVNMLIYAERIQGSEDNDHIRNLTD